jgi:hypothetical protein
MPTLHIYMKVEKNGIILHESYQRGHSWTRNAHHFFHNYMLDVPADDDHLFFRNTFGYFREVCPSRSSSIAGGSYCGFFNNGNTLLYGITVGTGDTAFHLDDFVLETPIAAGNGAGELYHQAQSAPVTLYSGDPDFTLNALHTRVFNNNSGDTIDVKEVGIVYYSAQDSNYYLFSRDVLAAPVEVLNAAQLTVSISITTQSMSAIDPGLPDIGDEGSGGIYIGQFDYLPSLESPGSHRKYGLILGYKADSENAGVKWRDPAATLAGTYSYYGYPNNALLSALGADSPLGQWIDSVNVAAPGGFTDWYVPSRYEMEQIYDARLSIPVGEECTSENYWTSTSTGASTAYIYNPITGAASSITMTTSLKARCVRRFLISSWVAL